MPIQTCTRCWLSGEVQTPVMLAEPNLSAPLQVFIDSPSGQDDEFGRFGSSMVSRLTIWLLQKCSLTPEEVGINFVLRCCGSKLKKKAEKLEAIEACSIYSEKVIKVAKSLLGLGELSSLRLTRQTIDRMVYQEHKKILHCPVFIAYSPGYLLQKPAETVDVIRMVFRAAQAAGLNPKVDTQLPIFDFNQI